MTPEFVGSWRVLEHLGGGGQGQVYKVRSAEDEHRRQRALDDFLRLLLAPSGAVVQVQDVPARERLYQALLTLSKDSPPSTLGAAKILHQGNANRTGQAMDRFAKEIQALETMKDEPGIIRLLDANANDGWMVTRFCAGGTLEGNLDRFKGDVVAALRAIRPVIAALAALHAKGYVHRDVKTANILIDEHQRLVLGDFGIIFREASSRPTEELERVGSRDWMPHWYNTGGRVDEVTADFDVFAVGKVLWCMVSGERILPLWYWNHDHYQLEHRFPGDVHSMRVLNRLLARTVVEHQRSCLPSAFELLSEVDAAMTQLAGSGARFHPGARRGCVLCRQGEYVPLREGHLGMVAFVDRESWQAVRSVPDLFTSPQSRLTLLMERCDRCGHLQLYSFMDGKTPAAWIADGHQPPDEDP